jgi:hypothetical protein
MGKRTQCKGYSQRNVWCVKRFATEPRHVSNASPMTKRKWLRQESEDFYASGFDALAKGWDKCINVSGGYVKSFFFRISHVLYFILICNLFTDSPS